MRVMKSPVRRSRAGLPVPRRVRDRLCRRPARRQPGRRRRRGQRDPVGRWGLPGFTDGLAAGFRGWAGTRFRAAGHLEVTAAFRSGGHAGLRWTIRPRLARDGWEACLTTWIEGGQHKTDLAAGVRASLTPDQPAQLRLCRAPSTLDGNVSKLIRAPGRPAIQATCSSACGPSGGPQSQPRSPGRSGRRRRLSREGCGGCRPARKGTRPEGVQQQRTRGTRPGRKSRRHVPQTRRHPRLPAAMFTDPGTRQVP